MKKKIFSILVMLVPALAPMAQLRLPAILSPGMVLQQNDSAVFWGWGYNGQEVRIAASWSNLPTVTKVNNVGRWETKIKTPTAGGPYTISIHSAGAEITLNDVLIGEVWLCSGQSNMEWSYYNGVDHINEELPVCYNKSIRFFHIERSASEYPQDDVRANWAICDSNHLKRFSAVGYFFGKRLHQQLNVPVGLINSTWGGTPAEVWTPAEAVNADPVLKKAADELVEVPWGPVKTAVNYNGMLAGITRHAIAGAIWYQGESNAVTNSTYSRLLTAMIDAWRKKWKRDFPFYYVQIAPYKYGNKNIGALLQEQQTKAMTHPRTGMVVVTDLVDNIADIHPRNKRTVGERLAAWALNETYSMPAGAYKSPVFRSMEIRNDKILLQFDHAENGWLIKGNTANGFFISGSTEAWEPAEVKIEKDKLVIWSKKIKQPAHVRFGFGNTIVGNVFNKEGLPLCPFRTDNWDVDQGAEK